MVIVWSEKGSGLVNNGGGDAYRLFPSLSVSLSSSLSSWREGLGHRGRGSISSQAEPGSCHRLDSCHANTPTTIIGALMGLSLTWERGGGEGGVSRGKSVLREICRGERRQWRWRQSSGCRVESEVKTERKR